MNDKDFDKAFGDKLREERYFASIDKDWETLNTRLDTVSQTVEEKKRRRAAAWLWLLALPLLSFLLWQINSIKTQNNDLATQLSAVQSQLSAQALANEKMPQSVSKTDTIVVYKNATPLAKANKKTAIPVLLSNKNTESDTDSPVVMSKDFSTKKADDLVQNAASSLPQRVVNQDTVPPKQVNEEKKIAELNEKLAALDKQLAELKQLLSDNKINVALITDCGAKQDSLKKQLLDAVALADSLKKHPLPKESGSAISIEAPKADKSLKNNRLFVGLQYGKINYRTTWVNSLGIDLFKDIKSYQASVKVEYALTDKLRVVAEGDFCPFAFTNFWQDKRYNLPALQFDPTKEKFLKAEAKQTLLQGNIGAKYLFTEGSAKWRPYVSAAYSMMHIKPFETKFTYQPSWGPNREQTVQSNAINVPNLLMLNGGLEYRFSKYGVAQAEVFYYKDVNKTKKTFDLFGIRAALLLNLK
jgi:hypothetical protein